MFTYLLGKMFVANMTKVSGIFFLPFTKSANAPKETGQRYWVGQDFWEEQGIPWTLGGLY